jgi:uncharacterized membrane protein YhaH (DUF805 family)
VILLVLIVVAVVALFVFGVRRLKDRGSPNVLVGVLSIVAATAATTWLVMNFSV